MVSKRQKFLTVILVIVLAIVIVGGVFGISYMKGDVTFPWQLVETEAKKEEVKEPAKEQKELKVTVKEPKSTEQDKEVAKEEPKEEKEQEPIKEVINILNQHIK